MAKKRANGMLADWGDDVPPAVQDAADKYMEALRAKGKAQETMNTAKEKCIAAMKEANLERIRIDDGQKWLVLEGKDSIRTEKIKEPTAVVAEE